MLPAAHRLRRAGAIRRVLRRGRVCSNRLLTLRCYRDEELPGCRTAFAVGKKVGGAVVRNRVRRRLREAVRSLLPQCEGRFDALVIARPEAANAGYHELWEAVRELFARARLLREVTAPGTGRQQQEERTGR